MNEDYKDGEGYVNKLVAKVLITNKNDTADEIEELGTFLEDLNKKILFLNQQTEILIDEKSLEHYQEIANMIQQVENCEKDTKFSKCSGFFNFLDIFHYINAVSMFIDYTDNKIINSLVLKMLSLVSHITSIPSFNFDELSSLPVIECIVHIFEKKHPGTLVLLTIFVRNILDSPVLFEAFKGAFNIQFFNEVYTSLDLLQEEEKKELAQQAVMCLYLITRNNHTKEEAEQCFDALISFAPFIENMPIAIGYFAYALTNQITADTFNAKRSFDAGLMDIITKLLDCFIKPYKDLTEIEQESLGNVLLFYSNLLDLGYDIPEVELAFLCDVLRNGNEFLFHSASLILSQQAFDAYDIHYLEDIVSFIISMFDASARKKRSIISFLCDMIVSIEGDYYEVFFTDKIIEMLMSMLDFDFGEYRYADILANALLKLESISNILGKYEELKEIFLENIDNMEEFCNNYEDTEAEKIVRDIINRAQADEED